MRRLEYLLRMKSGIKNDAKAVSEAKLAANRANSQLSSGPKTDAGKARSRSNALKHGLNARVACDGPNGQRNREFFEFVWELLDPRNPLEAICAANLVQSRLQEDLLLDVERTVVTRPPLSLAPVGGQPFNFAFLQDASALGTLGQLTRHVTHLTRVSEKDILALVTVRKENWPGRTENNELAPAENLGVPEPGEACVNSPPDEQAAATPVCRGTLAGCLADKRLIMPEEDARVFGALAAELWATFRPVTLLEGFVCSDFVKTEWRLSRVPLWQNVLLDRNSISASGDNCGFGFSFVQDSQHRQALETLRLYAGALSKRLSQRLALWRKLRKSGWTDACMQERPEEPVIGPADQPSKTAQSSPTVLAAEPCDPVGPATDASLEAPCTVSQSPLFNSGPPQTAKTATKINHPGQTTLSVNTKGSCEMGGSPQRQTNSGADPEHPRPSGNTGSVLGLTMEQARRWYIE